MPRGSATRFEVEQLRQEVAELRLALLTRNGTERRYCELCDEAFTPTARARHQRFCSASCRTQAYRARRNVVEPGFRGSHGAKG